MQFLKKNYLKISLIITIIIGLFFIYNKPEYKYEKVDFSNIKGWQNDDISTLFQPFLARCKILNKKNYNDFSLEILNKPKRWKQICEEVVNVKPQNFKQFIEKNFQPYFLNSKAEMLYTGYYKPVIKGSFTKTQDYKYPIYGKPKDIIKLDLAKFGIKDGGKTNGRIQNGELIPYYTRKEIDNGNIATKPILWVKNYIDKFFLQIQGSGTVEFVNGKKMYIKYAGNNGHKYTSIGRVLIQQENMKKEDISLFSIKKWLKDNPEKAQQLMQKNERYIFFSITNDNSDGALKIPLQAERSLAVDPKYIPLGNLVFINTTLTANKNKSINTTLFTQDTGSAIRGASRADIFFGDTKEAEYKAAYQNSKGKLYLFAPKLGK